MKTIFLCKLMLLSMIVLRAQNLYYYPLNGNFNEATASTNPLTPWPNATGQTGSFVSNQLPGTTCNGQGVFAGYEYANNAGLRFAVPPGTLGCEYSIIFTWRYDNPGGFQEWIRLLSFVYTDDAGLDLWTQFPSLNGTLYYWYLDPILNFPGFCLAQPTLAALSPNAYFNDTDYFRVALTRNCTNLLRVYANGNLVGSFNDIDQRYMPQAPSNQIVFFRDTADTSCYPTAFPDEASSGFVKDIILADYEFSAAALVVDYDSFCPVLLGLDWERFNAKALENQNQLAWSVSSVRDVEYFTVERSENGQDFYALTEISAQQSLSYRYTDFAPQKARHYYRISAMLQNGSVTRSEIRSLKTDFSLHLYPNPVQDYLHISAPFELAGQELQIRNNLGQILLHQRLQAGVNQIDIGQLPAGILLVQVAERSAKPIIKIK
ncbi:MAG: T9SS type A sorting domain-containing protein [Bacteroidota bacterium]